MKKTSAFLSILLFALIAQAQHYNFKNPRLIVGDSPNTTYHGRPFDIDNDGLWDLAYSAIPNPDTSFWDIQQQDGSFIRKGIRLEGLQSTEFARKTYLNQCDIDGDGDNDYLVGYRGEQGALYWYENLGGLVFSEAKWIDWTLFEAFNVTIADLDMDGDLEVIWYTDYEFHDYIHWYEFTGEGFGPANLVPDLVVTDLKVGDMDRNGYPDLITSTVFGLYWHPNLGNGVFGNEVEVAWAYDSNIDGGLNVFDMEGDGDLDLFPSGKDGNTFWYENLVGGTSFKKRLLALGNQKILLYTDWDNDGDIDLWTALSLDGQTTDFIALAENNGKRFDILKKWRRLPFAISDIIDLDNDMDLDLWVNKNYDCDISSYCYKRYMVENLLIQSCHIPTLSQEKFRPRQERIQTTLSWDTVGIATGYEVRIRKGGKLETMFVTENTLVVDLFPNTAYSWQVRTVCGVSEPSKWSKKNSFVTPGVDGRIEVWDAGREVREGGISIFPNPTSSKFFISGIKENSQISLFNLQGKLILETSSSEIDISKYPTGVYVVKVISEHGVWVGKVVRE